MSKMKSETLKDNFEDKINPIFSSLINHKNIGTTTLSENILTSFQLNEIKLENSTIIGTKLVETDNSDKRYLKAIKRKGEIAIIKDEKQLIDIIKLKSLEKILKLIGTTLPKFYYDISFGIYSCEEIVELRKTSDFNSISQNNNLNEHDENYSYCPTDDNKLENLNLSNDIIFDSEQKKLKILNQGKEIEIDRKTYNKKEKIFENELTLKKEEKYKQKEEINNMEKRKSKEFIDIEKNITYNKKTEKEKLRKEKTESKIEKSKNINKALILKNKDNEINKKKIDIKIKDNNKAEHKLIKSKEIIKKNHPKKNQMTVIVNNNIYKKPKKNNLLTPNRLNNKKIIKQRNISTILQSKKQNIINLPSEKSRTNLKKRISKKNTSNIKNKIIKRDINIRTFKCNKRKEHNTNDKMTIKDFYLQNKDRYDNKTWDQNKYNINKNKLNDINIEKIKQNPKCIKCECIQDINKNSGIYICENCKGLICGICSKVHYLKNPEHQCHYIKFNIENFTEENINNKVFFNNNSELFDMEERKRPNLFVNKITTKIKSNDIIFTKKCVMCNDSLLFNKEQIYISNCLNCKGNLCEYCSKKHLEMNKKHSLFNLKVIFIKDNNNYDNYLIPKLNCGICQKQINDFDIIYYCDMCKKYLCEECENNHSNKYLEHSLYYIKRILYRDEVSIKNKDYRVCRQCETNLMNNAIAFRKCVQCKIYLCQPCSESHIQKYNNHNILYAIDINNNNQSNISVKNNKNYKEIFNHKYYSSEKKRNKIKINYKCDEETKSNIINPISSKNEKVIHFDSQIKNCINCKSKINDIHKSNLIIGYLCPSCDNNCDNDLNSFYKINNSHLSEFIFDKYIYNIKKDELNICKDCEENLAKNRLVHFCTICKEKLCNNCVEKHINDNPEHIIICFNDKMLQKNNNQKF